MNFEGKKENSESYLETLYNAHIQKIKSIDLSIKISQAISLICAITFIIMLGVKLEAKYPFIYLLIPSLTCIVGLNVAIIRYLQYQELYTQPEEEPASIGTIVSYFSLVFFSANVFIYLCLMTAKLDNLVVFDWNILSIPLYLGFGVSVFYYIFILPALKEYELYWDIILYGVSLLSSIVFTILLNFKFDKTIQFSFCNIFAFMIIPIGLYLLYYLINLFKNREQVLLFRISRVFSFLLFLCVSIIVPMSLDKFIKQKDIYLICTILTCIGFISLIYYKFLAIATDKDEITYYQEV